MSGLLTYDHIFTHAAQGWQRVDEYQIAAKSGGLPDKTAHDLVDQVRYYEAPSNLAAGKGPEAFQYVKLPDGFAAVTYFRDKGAIKDRPGNFLAHSLVFRLSDAAAAGFNVFPLLRSSDISTDYEGKEVLDDTEREASPFDSKQLKPGLEVVRSLFGNLDALRSLLVLAHPASRTCQILLAEGTPKEMLDMLALIFALTPAEGRPELTFTTYAARPVKSGCRFVGNSYLDLDQAESMFDNWLVFGKGRAVKEVSGYASNDVVDRVDKIVRMVEADKLEDAIALARDKDAHGFQPDASPRPVGNGRVPAATSRVGLRGNEPKSYDEATASAQEIVAEAKKLRSADQCILVYKWGEGRTLRDPDYHPPLWELGPPVAAAMIAARAKTSPQEAVMVVVRTAAQCLQGGSKLPEALLATLRGLVCENPDADPLRRAFKKLPRELRGMKESISRFASDPEPKRLGILTEVVSALQDSPSSYSKAEVLGEIQGALVRFRQYLKELPPQRFKWIRRLFARRPVRHPVWLRLRSGLLVASVIAVVQVEMQMKMNELQMKMNELQRTQVQQTKMIAESTKTIAENTKTLSGLLQAARPAAVGQAGVKAPMQLPLAAQSSATVSSTTAEQNQPSARPLEAERKKVQDCVRGMLYAAASSGVKVSPMQRSNAETNMQSDANLLRLWMHLYIAYKYDPTTVVDLRLIPIEKLADDPLYETAKGIMGGKLRPGAGLEKFAAAGCPVTPREKP